MTRKIILISTSLLLLPSLVQAYDNPNSRQALRESSPLSLKIRAGEQEFSLESAASLQDGLETGLAPKKYSSLPNYFYSQSGTSHPWTSYNFSAKVKGLGRQSPALGSRLLKLASVINRRPQNAQLLITDGKATRFVPDLPGQSLDLAAAQETVLAALLLGQDRALTLALVRHEPEVKLGSLNNLGIRELVASGQSDFASSSRSRINNIKVGASQFNGLIIPSGAEFSFNQSLGPINAKRGYLPELVIKREGTLPELGGGLCQVSTTAFRAAFFGGLPITARRNHSFAVRYYEWISDESPKAVGLDATIYPGAQDMKFINDTEGSILIWTRVEGTKLYFDFYGTPDDRQVVVDGPHPFDKKASGAVKSRVGRTVIKDGQTQEATFNSNYVSPNLYPRIYEFPKPAEPQPITNN